MSLTKEMITAIDKEVELFSDEELLIYHNTYIGLHQMRPNSYDKYKVTKSFEEITKRGIEDKINEFSIYR
jgi:hypothetical protein